MINEMRDRSCSSRRRLGAVMSEMVLVMPLLVAFIAFLFFFGRGVVRVQHTSVMARYETWRQVTQGHGPYADGATGHALLNESFFAGNADLIEARIADNAMPDDTYEELARFAEDISPDAATLTEVFLYRPPGRDVRLPTGRRLVFAVDHDEPIPVWQPLEGAIVRGHVRLGREWKFVNDPDAGPDTWRGNRGRFGPHLQRAVRDVPEWYLLDLDELLDNLDNDTGYEYGDSSAGHQHPPNDNVAGHIRRTYLNLPSYRGPIIQR